MRFVVELAPPPTNITFSPPLVSEQALLPAYAGAKHQLCAFWTLILETVDTC